MPEDVLCIVGKRPKTFSYIDDKKGKYIVLECKLKEEITEKDLKRFFNRVYNARLNNSYEQILNKNYTTLDLINCLKELLKEEKVINLKKICNLLSKENNANWMPLLTVMKEFFQMFNFSGTYYNSEVFDAMERYANENPWFVPGNSNFPKEVDAMFYNSCIMNIMNDNSMLNSTTEQKSNSKVLGLQKKAS